MRKMTMLLATVCVMIMVVVFFEFFVFKISMQPNTNDPYFATYNREFSNTPQPGYNYTFNYTFSPPISMYHSLLIALESVGWNKTLLDDRVISVGLYYYAFPNSTTEPWGDLIHPVTQPVADWLPQQINVTTYRYIWIVEVGPEPHTLVPPHIYYVDAGTAELVWSSSD